MSQHKLSKEKREALGLTGIRETPPESKEEKRKWYWNKKNGHKRIYVIQKGQQLRKSKNVENAS